MACHGVVHVLAQRIRRVGIELDDGEPARVDLADQYGVVVFGLRGNAYRSDDLGNSWRQLPTGTPVTISAGLRTADGRLLLATQAGQLLISGDRGASFAPLAGAAGLPLAAVTEAPDGLVLASLRGLRTVALPKP